MLSLRAVALDILRQEDEQQNIAAAAAVREFSVSVQRFWARWGGQQSRFERLVANRKPSDTQGLAVCQYLNRLDEIGMSARHFMVIKCANAVLFSSYEQHGGGSDSVHIRPTGSNTQATG